MAGIRFPKVPHLKDSTDPQIYDHLTIIENREIESSEEELNVKGVAFDSTTNKIYLLESGLKSSHISIFSQSAELLYTLKTVLMKNPCGIAIDEDNIYFTDLELDCVFHFKIVPYFHLVGKVGKKGSGDEEFNCPYQLAVSIHGDVFVTDCWNNRIKIINRFLKYQNHISHYSMTKPCDVKLSPVSVYVLSPRDSASVHVFSYTGEKIRSFITGKGIGRHVVSPQLFCLDANENLIISNRSWADQLKIFSKEGTLLHLVGKRDDEAGELEYPRGIALINNRKIAIVSRDENYYFFKIFS